MGRIYGIIQTMKEGERPEEDKMMTTFTMNGTEITMELSTFCDYMVALEKNCRMNGKDWHEFLEENGIKVITTTLD